MFKKILIKTILIFISLILCATHCENQYPEAPLLLRNNSEQRIYYWIPYWKYTKDWTKYCYPDTIIPQEQMGLLAIGPHNTAMPTELDPDWEGIFSKLPAGKYSVYFFKNDCKTQKEWDSIRANNAYYRKDVTLQELINNSYTIYYP